MILSAVLQWGWHLRGKRTAVGYSSFCLQLSHPRNRCVCRISSELSVIWCFIYCFKCTMPVKWQWWSTPLTCGFHVNSSSLLPREITLPLVNTLFLLVLPTFQFVLYSSLQRLFSLFYSPRKSFLCLFLHLSPGVESSQEPLHGHCHAAREAACELYYWSSATCPQESGKEK